MIIYNIEVLADIESTNQKNVLLSPFYIFRSEKVAHQGRYFIKAYLYKTFGSFEGLSELRFIVKFETEVNISVHEFRKVESIQDENAFGCLVELPKHIGEHEFGSSFEIRLVGYIVNNELTDFSNQDFEVFRVHNDNLEERRRKFLQKTQKNYIIDPQINNQHWTCSCAKVNRQEIEICENCGTTRIDFEQVLQTSNFDFDKLLSDYFISHFSKSQFDLTKDFETNFVNLTSAFINEFELEKTDLIKNPIMDEYIKSLEETIINIRDIPMVWESDLDLNQNLRNHLTRNGLSDQFFTRVFGNVEMEKLSNDFSSFKKAESDRTKSKIRNRNITIGVMILVVASVSIFYFVFYPGIRYNQALKLIKENRYDEALSIFTDLKEYKDSPEQITETIYLKVCYQIDEIEKDFSPNLDLAEEIKNVIKTELSNYKDSESNQLLRLDYIIGKYQSRLSRYTEAYNIFSQLAAKGFRDSNQLRLENEYLLYKSSYETLIADSDTTISDIEEYIQRITSLPDYEVINGQSLLVKPKADIIDMAFRSHYYINDFPTKDEYRVALKYCQENPTLYNDKIYELKVAIKFSGNFEGFWVGYDSEYRNEVVYIDTIDRSYYVRYYHSGTTEWLHHTITVVNDGKLKISFYDELNGYIYIKNGNLYYDSSEGLFDYVLKPY